MAGVSFEASRAVDRRMALAREWDSLVEQVRTLPGFGDFLRPPPVERLRQAAAGGPVVVVNVSDLRCDALFITTASVTSQRLSFTADEAMDRTTAYVDALRAVENSYATYSEADARAAGSDASPGERLAQQRALRNVVRSRQTADDVLSDVVAWLWHGLGEPVLDQLGLTSPPEAGVDLPRLWWCPTGPLALLPLHAAGIHRTGSDGGRRTVMDCVVSSYTPTVRALLEARHRVLAASPEDRLLVVAVGDAPGQPPLPGVTRERDTLIKLFPGSAHTLLEGPTATAATVVDEMARHRSVHFACHADQDLLDPSQGGLHLHDGKLTIETMSRLSHSAEFVGLSACQTATGGIELLNEVITLAAALHYTGCRHVVASLWSVEDSVSADVFAGVYRRSRVAGQFRPEFTAGALHAAVLAQRDEAPHRPTAWAPFVHLGP